MTVPHSAPWQAWPLLRSDARRGEVEAIHQLRVATRRLRSAREAGGIAAPRSLRRLGRRLGEVRIWDIRRQLLVDLASGPEPVDADLLARLLERIDRKRARRLAALRPRLRGRGLAPCSPPPEPGAEAAIEALDAQAGGWEDPALLHALRLALKELRYALEWLEPESPILDPLRAALTALGDHRDWLQLQAFVEAQGSRWAHRGRAGLADATGLLADLVARHRAAAFDAATASCKQLRERLPAMLL
ncbi:MAG TPA: CHAD domain-containing protein [Holophagaceae bacterium]|nr:CHAD domain-containing protein [Holophagaceae bacterium]